MYVRKDKGWSEHLDFIIWDAICIELSFLLAYFLRHGLITPYDKPIYRSIGLMLIIIDLLIIFFGNSYSDVMKRGYFKEFCEALKQAIIIILLVTLYLFAVQEGASYSRIVMAGTGVIYLILTYCSRLLQKHFKMKNNGTAKKVLLLATTEALLEETVTDFTTDSSDFTPTALVVIDKGLADGLPDSFGGLPIAAGADTLIDYISRSWVDEILFVLPERGEYSDLIQAIVESGITVHLSLGKAENELGKKQIIENISGHTVMTTSINNISYQQEFVKRAFDIVAGLVGSVIACLALIIIGPIIYIQSPGPIIFKQKRVGRNGKVFNFLKIRSMILDADAMKKDLMAQNRVKDGMMFKMDFDPRIIGAKRLEDGNVKKGIGNFIRDWSIDELPQFFNVLAGDMSLVGTRPPTIDEWNKYQLHHRARLAFKPGITGLWQVSGRSNITDFEEVVKLDTTYITNWSFGLDLRIIFKTFKAVVSKSGSM